MKKIDRTVLRETAYIALCVTAMTAVVCLVFLLIGKWSTSVLLGGLLGTAVSVLNFFLMGVTVQSAVGKNTDFVIAGDKAAHAACCRCCRARRTCSVLQRYFDYTSAVPAQDSAFYTSFVRSHRLIGIRLP